jgi:ABC-type phosphate/phosphonate transport system substrate-binding protein
MKFVISLFISSIFSIFLIAAELQYANMGILNDGIANTKGKDYSVAFEILIRKISAKNDMTGKMTSYDKATDIVHDFIVHKLDYIMINPYYLLENENRLIKNTAVFWSVRKAKDKFEKMLVLVGRNKGINKISDLKNKTVALKEDNYMGKVVLDKALLESSVHHSYKHYIKNIQTVKTHSRAILQLYFGKIDAAIVPKYTYDLMCEMNPAVKKRVKVIYETKSLFMPIVCMVNKKTKHQIINDMKTGAASFPYTKNGRNVLALFKMTHLDIFKDEELKVLRNYYHEYKTLEKKYGKQQ